jgi:two-component system cell cycle sensor histidine kinase/response regulator CckA
MMKQPLTVLMVEDSPEDAKLVVRELSHGGFDVTHRVVANPKDMRDALAERTWDIILSDHALPEFSGSAALKLARELAEDTPLIFVSGTIGEDVAVEAMRSGARDYVMKDSLARLSLAVTRELREAQNRREAKRAEEALRWRQALFEAQMDSNSDGIMVVDGKGRKILQNRRMSELWQIPPEIADDPDDARQVEFVTTRTKNPKQFANKVHHLYTHTNDVSHDEIELIDGRTFDRYSAPVRDKHGKYYGRIWTFRDITERKTLETQLRQAQKMDAIGQLAGGVAHDFNNILTATMMHLGMLRNTLCDEETQDALKELELQTQRAADLTRQLLMFSRKSAMEIKPIDLNVVVDDMLKMLRRLLGEQVTVQFNKTPWLPSIEADSSMMQQVLMNLALNARDAMPKGGQLTLSTDVVELGGPDARANPDRRAGWFVKMSVADTGCGMDEAVLKRIFEPFFTTKELGKGTGLGLATVYGIVKQHQGWTEVESSIGTGSTFHVYLPVSTKAKVAESRETDSALKGGTETILLVEDEAVVRNVTARWLQMLGYRVIEATNGQEAMDLWAKHASQVQLLFTDMVMPCGISGLELAERFQQQAPDLKVIIASGYSSEISAQGIPTMPGMRFLQKPFKAQMLATAVRGSLDGAVEKK